MGIWDSYCFITGARFLHNEREIRDVISLDAGCSVDDLSRTLRKGLIYSLEDVHWSQKYVLICPYEVRDNGRRRILTKMGDPKATICTPETITVVYNVAPSHEVAEAGDYRNKNPDEGDDGHYTVSVLSPIFLITHGAYLMVLEASPELAPHVLFRLFFDDTRKITRQLDYGPINGVTGEQFVFWPGIGYTEDGDQCPRGKQEAASFWKKFKEGKSDNEILHEAWRGRGNLWAMVRPDRFPIADTTSTGLRSYAPTTQQKERSRLLELPLELLLLLCEHIYPPSLQSLILTSKTIHSRICAQVDPIIHAHIQQYEPWYLPAGPFDIPEGSEEVDWWDREWTVKLNLSSSIDLHKQIPWFQYRRACSHSMSMWNRIRIWRVIKQLEILARKLD